MVACDIRKEPSLEGEGQRQDEEHEESHLQHQEDEHLLQSISTLFPGIRGCAQSRETAPGSTYESVVKRHGDGGRGNES